MSEQAYYVVTVVKQKGHPNKFKTDNFIAETHNDKFLMRYNFNKIGMVYPDGTLLLFESEIIWTLELWKEFGDLLEHVVVSEQNGGY